MPAQSASKSSRVAASAGPVTHHYLRTMVAATLGAVAMFLVSASILAVWANRTLTDTNTYIQTVGPVLERPELQDFVATKVADQVVQSAPITDLATQLLPANQLTGKTPQQLEDDVRVVLHDSAVEVLKAPAVEQAWKDTNRNAHAELVRQLDAGAPQVSINLAPILQATVTEMKQTKLAPVVDKIDATSIDPSKAQVTLNDKALKTVRNAYTALKTTAPVLVLVTLLLVALSVWASVHHTKTLRRMLVGTGVSTLLLAAALAVVSRTGVPGSDPTTAKLAAAIVGTLLHGLQMGCLVLGIACLVLAGGSKLYERRH